MREFLDKTTGNTYDISHLQKHAVEYVQPAQGEKHEIRYSVEVSYSDHCYTKSVQGTARMFDLDRYEQSKLLPKIMSELMSRECHHTGRTNFVTFDIDEHRTYEVYFEVFKKDGKLYIRVQSAYIRDAAFLSSRPARARIRFHVILFNVYHEKSIHPPR